MKAELCLGIMKGIFVITHYRWRISVAIDTMKRLFPSDTGKQIR
jgi:hypothetical protein